MIDDYKRVEKLGEGSYGIVYKAIHRVSREVFAMKKVRIESKCQGIPATTLREISSLKELSEHPNIVRLKEVLMSDEDDPGIRLYLVFEYLPMDLKKFIDDFVEPVHIDLNTIKSLTYQLLRGLLFCHQRRFLHRDLKPQNLLIDHHGILKIADFGLARAFNIPIRAYTHEVVTLWYRAPEVLLSATHYSCPVDIWSVACIMAELVTKKPLFQGDSEIDQIFKIFKVLKTPTEVEWPEVSELPDFNHTFPSWTVETLGDSVARISDDEAGMDLLRKMLVYSPEKRETAKSAIKHSFFDDFDKSQLPEYEQGF